MSVPDSATSVELVAHEHMPGMVDPGGWFSNSLSEPTTDIKYPVEPKGQDVENTLLKRLQA